MLHIKRKTTSSNDGRLLEDIIIKESIDYTYSVI